ncbi:MAG TPA: hypothetical protein VFE47_20545 [Tepidisphaeraceae bacterium]|nr:hypothetical protein [Tepidisphaeraceae bacterium]
MLTRRLRLIDPTFKLKRIYQKLAGSVISDSFLGKGDSDRQDMIWDALEEEYGVRAVRMVGTLLAYTQAEWNMDFIDPDAPPAPPIPYPKRRVSRPVPAKHARTVKA